MGLPYVRKPEYLSHSSLRKLEENPVEFYLQRCAPPMMKPDRELQDATWAVGTSFDAHVKHNLALVVGCPCPPLEKMLSNIEAQNCGDVIITREGKAVTINPIKDGKRLFEAYRDCGAFDALINEGLSVVELEPAHQHVPGTMQTLMGKEVSGVPIMGHPDAMLIDEHGARVVLDWKVTSAGSPNKGYRKVFSVGDMTLQYAPPHAEADRPMEELNEIWAMQLAVYSWLMRDRRVGNAAYFMPVKVAIDQVVYGSASVKVAQYRTHITGQFQTQLRHRYVEAWEKIQSEKLVPEEYGDNLELVRALRAR